MRRKGESLVTQWALLTASLKGSYQGSGSWQPFGENKNGHKNFRQVRIYFIRDKCVVFARNCKFANLTQYNMQNIPCNSAFLAQETLFLTKKNTFLPKDLQQNA